MRSFKELSPGLLIGLKMTRNEYIDILKKTAIQTIKKQVIAYCISKAPFLRMRFFNPILSLIIEKLVVYIVNETELRLFFVYSDFRTSVQANAYVEAMNAYNQDRSVENEAKLIDAFTKFCSLVL